MVVHDEARVQAWVQTREKKREKGQRRPPLHLSVVAVQSIACCVAVLVVLLFRMAGGEAYQSLRRSFQQGLARNEWVSSVAQMWDGDPIEKVKEDVKQEAFTDEEAAPLADSPAAVAAVAPLESGILTSGYGDRVHPIDGTQEFHTGVDIAAPSGTPLLAPYDGEVVEVGENDRLGKFVRLRHGDGIEIVYGHCEAITVSQGASICAGEQVALVGSTGVSTGSHVHIRVSIDGNTCDPAALLPIHRYA